MLVLLISNPSSATCSSIILKLKLEASCRLLEVRVWCLRERPGMSMEPVYPSLSR